MIHPNVCPKCSAKRQPPLNAAVIWFDCGSMVDAGDGTWHHETFMCCSRQRDQALTNLEVLRDQLATALSDLAERNLELADARQQIGSLLSLKDERDEWRLLAEQAPDLIMDPEWNREYDRLQKLYPTKE